MKKLLELRQQKAALKTQMRSMLDKADTEKRSLNEEEGKKFDELRAQADALEVEITRLEAVADDQRNLPGTSVEGEPVSNDELRHYIMTGDTRSLSTLVQADGGYTVIPELDKEIMRQLQDDSVMRSISTVKTTKTNEYQKLVSVGGATVNRGTEGETRTETSTPKMERVDIKLNPIYAYDKAVEVVTDVVRTETRKEDMRMIEDTKKWVLSPERKAPKATREYAAHRLDTVLDKFLKTMQTTAARLQEKLLKPEVRQKGKEQVKEKARDSVLQLLNRLQAEQAQNKPAAQPRTQEGHSEI